MSAPNFMANSYNSCRGISLKNKNVNLMVPLKEKSGVSKVIRDSSSGDHECLKKKMLKAMDSIVVEIFQSLPQR